MIADGSRSRSSFLLCALVALAALAGPAADEARRTRAASAPPAAAAARQLCAAVQTLPETRKAACCASPASAGLGGECVRLLSDAVRRGAVALADGDAARCSAAAARQLEGCAWVTPYAPPLPQECRRVLQGRLAAGAACRSSLECVDGLLCWGAGPGTAGVCTPPAPVGATCGAAADDLATYTRQTDDPRHPACAGFCKHGRCAPFAKPGEACSGNEQCGPGAHCAAGRCTAGPQPELGDDCSSTACAAGLTCLDGRCAPPRKAGETCSKPAECAATCLPPGPDATRVCGMQCSAWPPAGVAPPAAAAARPRG